MNRTEAINKLKEYTVPIKAMGATSLFIFGSTIREEANADSDLDLFFGCEVDVTTRDCLHPMLRKSIEQSAFARVLMERRT